MALYFGPVTKEAQEILNYCTKYLIRDVSREPDGKSPTEGWRFPLVASVLHDGNHSCQFNEVTFIYYNQDGKIINSVEIVGSFFPMYKSLKLQQVQYDDEDTPLYYLTIILPVGKGYHYKFLVNGEDLLDPINPQRITLTNGKEWSFFYTDYYNYTANFEEWELNLLGRLVEQIVLFRTEDAQNFINRYYQGLTRGEKEAMPIHRLDQSVGEINYITNILAKEERHHLIDYKVCLNVIDQLLRKWNPFVNSWEVSFEMINDLYNQMATNNVLGWDYSQYNDPQYFLKLLRRHCITGAFCHPKYGGNIGGAGWNYLKEKYCIKDKAGIIVDSYFNWDLAIEPPLGKNLLYKG